MNFNRLALVVSFLLLLFFVSTSSGMADVSAIQDQLRGLQLKLVGQKIKQFQDQILQLGKPKPDAAAYQQAPAPSPEEMSVRLQNEITALESLVASLQPRALEERTAELENRISSINQQIQSATGPALLQLQKDLAAALADYNTLQQQVQSALEASLKEQQAAALRAQIQLLQQKILLLPRPVPSPVPQFSVLQDQIQKAQLKLIQAQATAIREKINQLKAQ